MKLKLTFVLLFLSLGAFSQTVQTYEIGILIDKTNPELAPLLEKLKSEIVAVVGEDANIRFPEGSVLVNDFDLTRAKQNYDQLLTNDTDIILAFGIVNNQVISPIRDHKKPTILFGAVNRDLHQLDLTNASSGIENFTYLVESESYAEDFGRFKELTNFKKLGIAVDAPFIEILPLEETFDRELRALGAEYKLIPFYSSQDIITNLNGIDAIYMAGGFFLSKEEKKVLASTFLKAGLPSFTVNGTEDVRNGIMATNQSDDNLDQFFRRIALTIEAYVSGRPLSELPVYIDYTLRLTINYNTAEATGVPIKYSLVGEIDFVGELKNGISEKDYNLLTAINDALKNNLSLNSNKKDVELALQDIKSANSNYLPSITASSTATYVDPDAAAASLGQNPEFSTGGNITLNQTLFSEAANANIAIQKSLQRAQEANFNAAELDLIFDVSNAYFNALILKVNMQIQARNVDLTKRNLEVAEQNFEAGQSGKSDMLRFRSEMAQNTQSMVEAINQLKQGFLALNQLLNNPADLEIDVEDAQLNEGIFEQYNYEAFFELLDNPTLREPFIDFLTEEAHKNAPELQSLDYNLLATERNIKLNSYGRLLPTLSLQGQYSSTFNRSGAGSTPMQGVTLIDNTYNAGLNLSIPIVNQNLTNINRQTAIIQKEQLELNKDNVELGIAVNIRNAILNLVNQMSNIQLSKISEETAEEALELTRVAYSNGAVNIVQLLDAQNNFLNAQLARANATYNYLINSLQVERFLGYYFLLNSEEKNNEFRQRFFEYLNTRN